MNALIERAHFDRGVEQSGSSTVSYAVGRGFESLSRIQINVVSCGKYPSVGLHPHRCGSGSRAAVTVKDRSHDATPVSEVSQASGIPESGHSHKRV